MGITSSPAELTLMSFCDSATAPSAAMPAKRFKAGDPHPSGDGRVFKEYAKKTTGLREVWTTHEARAQKLANKKSWKKRNPEKVSAQYARAKERRRDAFSEWYKAATTDRDKLWAYVSKNAPPPAKARGKPDREKLRKERNRRIWLKRVERAKSDPLVAARLRLRKSVGESFRRTSDRKTKKTEQLLGCSFAEAKRIIESRFLPGMSWDNRHLWHLDHRVPISIAKSVREVELLNHIDNLFPIWEKDNLKKGDKLSLRDLRDFRQPSLPLENAQGTVLMKFQHRGA